MKRNLTKIIVALLISFMASSVASATPVDSPTYYQPGSIDNKGNGLTDTAWDDVKWSATPSSSYNNQYPPYFQMKWDPSTYASYLGYWSNLPNSNVDISGRYAGWINYYYGWSSIVANSNYEILIQLKGVGSTGANYNMQVRFYAYDPGAGNLNYIVLDNIGLTV